MTLFTIKSRLCKMRFWSWVLVNTNRTIGALCLILALTVSGTSASASQSEWRGDAGIAEMRLLSAVSATGALDELPLALEFRIAPGWKIYWRTPGEAGLPPSIDLGQSPEAGLIAKIAWPLPKRFNVFGFDNYGYETHVILPLTLQGHQPGGLVQIVAQVEALACSDICVPVTANLDLIVPDGPALASQHASSIAQFAAKVPRMADASGRAASGRGLAVVATYLDEGHLVVRLAPGAPPIDDIFIEGFDGVAFKAPVPAGDGYWIPVTLAKGMDFTGGSAVMTVAGGGEMAEFNITITPKPAPEKTTNLSLLVFGIAFLGGVILNLMPCVLPVLALKLSSVLHMTGRSRSHIRLGFLAGAAGIITSFVILALALALLREAGGTVGWGIQFQNPVFLGIMIVLLGLFALNLADFIPIPLPRFIAALAAPSHSGGAVHGLFGDFLAGMLATILATPCSAPFVGTAVTLALTGSTTSLFGIFLAMGIGLATPWVMVALFPATLRLLPRPGAWMVWLKRLLALLLLATIIWLGGIMATLLDEDSAEKVGASTTSSRIAWESFAPEAVSAHVAEGRSVFIDVTADWCITCKANKALVLNQASVADRITSGQDEGRLVAMQADWTRPDPQIAAFLASHGRFGIPFDIVYGPARPQGVLLPELLTSQAVLEALELVQNTPK